MEENRKERWQELALRPTGRFPTVNVYADTLGEAIHKALIGVYEQGIRIETPKQKADMPLGFDAHVTINVAYPDREPMLHKYALSDSDLGLVQYIYEVTHGIHNHWKKNPNDPNDNAWGYTYNERFKAQIPFVLAKIKKDFSEKGRATGRDYFFTIWRPREDSILEQPDPPCYQNGQIRIVPDDKGELFLDFLTYWRSRDEAKAWLQNNVAQVRLQKMLAAKISNMLGLEIKVGNYVDTSSSLHIYGLYMQRDNFGTFIERMRRAPTADFLMNYSDFVDNEELSKRIVAAQMHSEILTGRRNISAEELASGVDVSELFKSNGVAMMNGEKEIKNLSLKYDINTFPYPTDWDTWPKEWDAEPNIKLLT